MAGLNCNSVSTIAWPLLRDGLDAAVAIRDDEDRRAMQDLAALGIDAGSCGAACLAGARVALCGDGVADRREHLGIDESSVVVLLVTERRLPGFVA
jgi:diaminopropionate ammonia-lyase